ncbi:hypothetical protein [Polaromonas sp. CG9_12]|nr:hypothetical protein [Polaromonas sp. CG9_12]
MTTGWISQGQMQVVMANQQIPKPVLVLKDRFRCWHFR